MPVAELSQHQGEGAVDRRGGKLDRYLRDSTADPYPTRRTSAPYWSQDAGAWVVTRYEDASKVLREASFESCDMHLRIAELAARAKRRLPNLILFLQAALPILGSKWHQPPRPIVRGPGGGLAAPTLAPAVEAVAQTLWADLSQRGGFDLAKDFAEVLPSKVMAHVFDVTQEQRQRFAACTYGLMGAFNWASPLRVYEDYEEKLEGGLDFVCALIEARRGAAGDDVMSRMVARTDQAGLQTRFAAACILFLYLAGVDQTSALIGTAALSLLQHPDQLALLRADGVSETAAVEELLRYESPAPIAAYRTSRIDREIAGAPIRRGDTVMVVLSAANRDPEVFTDPDRLDLTRAGPAHLAFSAGAHACIGAMFARLELAAALRCFKRAPCLALAQAPLSWWRLDTTRRLRHLPVTTGA